MVFCVLLFHSCIFMYCNFMPCKLVRQFHVRHFHVQHFQRPRRHIGVLISGSGWRAVQSVPTPPCNLLPRPLLLLLLYHAAVLLYRVLVLVLACQVLVLVLVLVRKYLLPRRVSGLLVFMYKFQFLGLFAVYKFF